MIARIIRKMQVPAKLPDDEGVQALEKSGVLCVFVKTMLMLIELPELELELELISMPSMSMIFDCWRRVESEGRENIRSLKCDGLGKRLRSTWRTHFEHIPTDPPDT